MTLPPPHVSPDYRPDIDGLRALAVAAVVAFHAFPQAVPGGFVGVDVFFVISGYLISTILLSEWRQTGRLDLLSFYRRRLRRIVPALAVVMVAVLALGWLVLLPSELALLGRHAAGAAIFIANVLFWNGAGYFAPGADHLPLLHLWSLAIEEQFYLVWPLALVALAGRPRLLVPAMVAAFVGSLALCLDSEGSIASFYSPLTRAWELLAGALLAAVAGRAHPAAWAGTINSTIAELSALAGLGLILSSALFLDQQWPWPGRLTLLPVAGAVLLVGPGAGSRVSALLLANPLAVGIGLISYPLYLWHWPLLSFGHILHAGIPPASTRLWLVLASAALAVATWLLVERPIRFGRLRRPAPAWLAGALASIALAGFVIDRADGFRARAITELNAFALTATVGAGKELTQPGCLVAEAPIPRPYSFCRRDKTLPVTHIVWGDSKGEALFWSLVRESHARPGSGGWQLVGMLGGCPPMGGGAFSPNPECNSGNEAILDAAIADDAIRTVALAAGLRTIRHNGLAPSQAGLDASVARLLAAGKRVVLVVDNPTVISEREAARDCVRVTLLAWLERLVGRRDCDLPLARHEAETADYRALIAHLVGRHPKLELFDTDRLLCDRNTGLCPVAAGGELLYSYGDHISDTAGTIMARQLLPLVEGAAIAD